MAQRLAGLPVDRDMVRVLAPPEAEQQGLYLGDFYSNGVENRFPPNRPVQRGPPPQNVALTGSFERHSTMHNRSWLFQSGKAIPKAFMMALLSMTTYAGLAARVG